MTAARATRPYPPANVVRLSEWRAAPVAARRRPARAPLVAGVALSAAAHALALLLLHAPQMAPPPPLPEPLEVVLVQPPVTLRSSTRAERAAPAPEPRRAQPRAPARGAQASPPPRRRVEAPAPAPADAPPVMTAPREEAPPAALSPPVATQTPAETQPSPSTAMAGRVGAAPGSAGATGAAPGPLSPPSFDAAYLRNPAPRYPLIARRNGEQGTVTLRVRVTRTGEPGSVLLERSSGSAALDAAALATVKEWRFVPARRDGEAVDASVLVPIVFRLRDAS